MSKRYILNDKHEAIQTDDLKAWAQWFENAERHLEKTTIGYVFISTVFLGLDHQFGNGRPMLFETMVFGGKLDGECERCSTWDQAKEQHSAMCSKVQAGRQQ